MVAHMSPYTLERLRDLDMMGDFTEAQYVMRRQALEEEPQRTVRQRLPPLTARKLYSKTSLGSGTQSRTRPSTAS